MKIREKYTQTNQPNKKRQQKNPFCYWLEDAGSRGFDPYYWIKWLYCQIL